MVPHGAPHPYRLHVRLARDGRLRDAGGPDRGTSPNGCVVFFEGRLDDRESLTAALGLEPDSNAHELVGAAYQRWGDGFPARLIGDFAVLVHEPARRRTVVARDVLGAHPCYYRRSGDGVAVATRARALTGARPALDAEALTAWAHLGYDDERALFAGIVPLKPGFRIHIEGDVLAVAPYWDWASIARIRYGDPRDYHAHFLETLTACIRDRCRDARGPVGITLSGGMDSPSIAAAAVGAGIELQPFSFRFETLGDCDESARSLAVARRLDLPEPIWVDCERFWLLKDAFMRTERRDDPFQSWDEMDRWITGRLAEMGGNVLLTGQGGDSMVTGVGRGLALGARVRAGSWAALRELVGYWRLRGLTVPAGLRAHVLGPVLSRETRIRLSAALGRDFGAYPWIAVPRRRYAATLGRLHRVARVFRDPLQQYLYNMVTGSTFGIRRLVHWQAALCAPFGVASRHPFFDRRIAGLVLSFPPELWRVGGKQKGLLREIMREMLPPTIIDGEMKPNLLSFYPDGVDCEQHHVKKLIEKSPLADRGIVDKVALRRAFETYLTGKPADNVALFGPTVLTDLWLRNEMSG